MPTKNNGGWNDINSDKYDANEHNRDLAADEEKLFSQIDDRGLGLRPFLDKELQARAATSSSGTNTTLLCGKIYLRLLPNGITWELLVYRQRSAYDAYYSEHRQELIDFAQYLIEGRG